ncbi:hypothetical protein EDC15_10426 [Acetobacter aceti NBRC 14818]|uniref:DUF4412 domain-containing protein n=2 Tax=Acetobacter aceti TaxID=435 RepID=A0AB33IHY4_ACEAC|nr:hypothetical protein [Acetobacter aceti]TCS34085.1 hypothetical protein EDC15_10426 [Acetobacter aceti NBRC 14818]BCK75627.1 hypothetical protein EMQ_1233 [Acetobacter aceti NBRC 14818]GAN56610.1 hypothetical protein Abac_009_023 [Acetobacter aceti NBRC 14818]
MRQVTGKSDAGNKAGVLGRCLALTLTAGLMQGTALAADGDHPPLTPLKDAVITYSVQPDGAPQPQQVKVWFTAEGARMRIDAPDGSASTILNRTAQTVTILLHKQRVFTQLEQRGSVRNPFLLDVSMQFTRHGNRTVAGIPCTEWGVASGHGDATACVTTDGLILAENGVDADGAKGHLSAESVSYETIPASAFAAPSDYQEVHQHRVAGQGAGAPALSTGPLGGAGSSPAGDAATTPAPAPSVTPDTAGQP